MVRSVAGYAVFAVVGIVALKLLFGVLGFALGLLGTILWFAAIGFVLYLILKVISPGTARRVRQKIRGDDPDVAA